MISPFKFFANRRASLDLPEAVGPAIKLLFFLAPFEAQNTKFNLILQLSKIFDFVNYKLQTTKFFDLY